MKIQAILRKVSKTLNIFVSWRASTILLTLQTTDANFRALYVPNALYMRKGKEIWTACCRDCLWWYRMLAVTLRKNKVARANSRAVVYESPAWLNVFAIFFVLFFSFIFMTSTPITTPKLVTDHWDIHNSTVRSHSKFTWDKATTSSQSSELSSPQSAIKYQAITWSLRCIDDIMSSEVCPRITNSEMMGSAVGVYNRRPQAAYYAHTLRRVYPKLVY